MAWIGTSRPLPTTARPQQPDAQGSWRYVGEVEPGAPVRNRFTLPLVYYVGSHEGCGCGFNSDDLAWQGFELDTVADMQPLLEGFLDQERTEFLAEQGSRLYLKDQLLSLLAESDVAEVFSCWAGGESDPAIATHEVTPDYFAEKLAPLGEGVKYIVRRCDQPLDARPSR